MAKLHRLDHNVYGVVELFHPAGSTNAGFIITENSIVHIDAGMTIADGNYLLDQLKKIAKKKKSLLLILTHHHSDHIFGMRVFKGAGAKVIAHETFVSSSPTERCRYSGPSLKPTSRSSSNSWSKGFRILKRKLRK